ncbi:hypothetical protein PISMIDRAFT_16481 [Pisolithus microcarpus 441]|uniref:Uncharacterized protein n=1 Tax=Pisolithus microcarpus 441 TaxID=765257 RepID=A0A0C9YG31_9AGAM|nr:hypothetical protein PISMIDRAFT_16481 [Pisolithus microcarpus 441]
MRYRTILNTTICSAVDISSDCTKFVAASYDTATAGNIRLFGITSGRRLLPPVSHSRIHGVKFSPDGSRFATASYDCGVRIYSTHDGKILFDSGAQGSTKSSTSLAWSSDSQQLFAASKGKITCFNISDSSSSKWSIHETQSEASIACNGRFIACSAGSSVSLWNCVSHEQIGSIIIHTAGNNCTALSPTGGYLACGVGKNITIHDLRDVLPSQYFDRGRSTHPHNATISTRPHNAAVSTRPHNATVNTRPHYTTLLASQLPLIQGDTTDTEMLLSKKIGSTPRPSHYLLAYRAMVRARLKYVALAIEDSEEVDVPFRYPSHMLTYKRLKSLRVQSSPIGYIAMAVALLGEGDREGALRTFDFAFHDCELDDIRIILLLKSILVFESGNREDAITRVELLSTRAKDDDDEDAIYLYTQARALRGADP